MPLRIVKGDVFNPLDISPSGIDILMHVVNNKGKWGAGFVLEIDKKLSKSPRNDYQEWHKFGEVLDDVQDEMIHFKLGEVLFSGKYQGSFAYVAHMIAMDGLFHPKFNQLPLQYDSLFKCLKTVAQEAKRMDAVVHCPMIGSGLAKGDPKKIQSLIEDAFVETDCIMYQL